MTPMNHEVSWKSVRTFFQNPEHRHTDGETRQLYIYRSMQDNPEGGFISFLLSTGTDIIAIMNTARLNFPKVSDAFLTILTDAEVCMQYTS